MLGQYCRQRSVNRTLDVIVCFQTRRGKKKKGGDELKNRKLSISIGLETMRGRKRRGVMTLGVRGGGDG